jgi:hypothetical protein
MRTPQDAKPGDVVVFHDPVGKPFNALISVNWGSCVNVVVIADDEAKKDNYGRQIERHTSISHKSSNLQHGFYWRWPEEEPNEYKAPLHV